MTATPTRGLIDGDIIVYRVGFASNDVSEKIALARVDQFIDNIMINADLTTVSGFITGTKQEDPRVENYRNLIAVTEPYKGNRPSAKPVHYEAIRRYLQNKLMFAYQYDQEADDAIAIEATKYRDEVVICSIDKDLRQVPGFHYNFVTNKIDYVTEDEGNRFFYRQILTGDRIDNVPGIRGIGPKKAEKIVTDEFTDIRKMYKAVWQEYQERNPDLTCSEVDDMILERGRLLWLRRKPGELWTPPNLKDE